MCTYIQPSWSTEQTQTPSGLYTTIRNFYLFIFQESEFPCLTHLSTLYDFQYVETHLILLCVICLQFRRLVSYGRILVQSCHLFTDDVEIQMIQMIQMMHNISASHCYLLLFDLSNIYIFNCYWKILDIHHLSQVVGQYIFCL